MTKQQMGYRLAFVRELLGLTQKSLAELAEINYNSYLDYEHGNSLMSTQVVAKFAKNTGVDANFIIGATNYISIDITKYDIIRKK